MIDTRMRLYIMGDSFWLARDVRDENGRLLHIEYLSEDGTWKYTHEGGPCEIIPARVTRAAG